MARIILFALAGLALAACGQGAEQRAATGGLGGLVAGAAIGGPWGALAGAGVGALGGAATTEGALAEDTTQ